MEMVKQQGNLDVLHVPYKGSGPVMTDLMSGLVGSFFAPYTPLMVADQQRQAARAGREQRETGPQHAQRTHAQGSPASMWVMTQWYGLVAPKGHTAADHRQDHAGGEASHADA